MAETGFLNTTNPVAELVAELNPAFEQRHKLDQRNVGLLLGDLTEVYDSMRLSTALEDLHKLPSGQFDPQAAVTLKELFLKGRRDISRHLFLSKLGVPSRNFKLADMNGGIDILLHQALGNYDGILEVVPVPGHEGDQDITSQRKLSFFGIGSISNDLTILDLVT